MLRVVLLSVFMLSLDILNVIRPSVVLQSVMAPSTQNGCSQFLQVGIVWST
jgi:hypothetical protein